MFELSSLIYGSAELSSKLGNRNITHDTELWDSDYYVLLLADVKVFSSFFEDFTCFIKKHPFGEYSVDQFPTIFVVSSYI